MALLWSDVLADVASSRKHFGQAVTIFERDLADGKPGGYVAAMAFQHAMQSGYTSFEAAVKRVLALLDEPLPVGPDAHAALLRRIGHPVEGSRPAVVDPDLSATLSELRRFRHVATHADDDFDPGRASGPAQAARAYLAGIDSNLARFRAIIDPG